MNRMSTAAAVMLCVAVAGPVIASERAELKARAVSGDRVAMRELARDYHLGIHGWRSSGSGERWARAAINAGDRGAELVLAQILGARERTAADDDACFWYLSAAHQGLDEATLEAGDCLARAWRRPAAEAQARDFYLRALATGQQPALRRLHELYSRAGAERTDEAVAERAAEARRWLVASAESGDAESMLELADALRDGDPPARDVPGAVNWYQRASEAGSVEARARLGTLLLHDPTVADPSRGLIELRLAADGGSAAAMSELGDAYRLGRGVPADRATAQRWYLLAGRAKDPDAAYQRGLYHLDPRAGAYSLQRAAYWMKRAALHGNAPAARRLGDMYLNGKGVDPHLRKGMEWLGRSAQMGYVPAQLDLVHLYLDGKVLTRDVARALRQADQLEDHVDGEIAWRLGAALRDGEGIDADVERAREWFAKGARVGDRRAMTAFAAMLEDGRGGPADQPEAARWFAAAADSGDARAMLRLAAMFDAGRGVAVHPARAAELRAQAAQLGAAPDPSWRPLPADRAEARATGRSVANLSWDADLSWGARDAIEVRQLPERGALRGEFAMMRYSQEADQQPMIGIVVDLGVEEQLAVRLQVLPKRRPKARYEHRLAELVIERSTGGRLEERTIVATGIEVGDRQWAEISWDEDGLARVRLADGSTRIFAIGREPVRAARAEIDSADGNFYYMTVD
jgi:hypothetical protein